MEKRLNAASSQRELELPLQDFLTRLQQTTDADMVLLGEVLTTPFPRVRTLCCRLDGEWQTNFSYVLATHPCQAVLASQQFQHWAQATEAFPQAFLLSDNRLCAYAGYPISLDTNGGSGILVLLSRRPWPDPLHLQAQLTAAAKAFNTRHGSVSDAIERARLLAAGSIRDEFFREYVLDNPAGVSFSELMPPLPIDLPPEQLLQRVTYSAFVVECNRAIARMYGYEDTTAMLGARPYDVNGPEKATRNVAYWIRENFSLRDIESQAVDAEGNITWIKGSVFGKVQDGKLLNFWTKRSDITAQKRYEAAIQHKAHHDVLTALPNRAWFQERIAILLAEHAARGTRLCVGLLDLNGFKEVNDTLGHMVGDLLLQAVAKRLLKGLKPHGAELARLGGDEFVILMPEVSSDDSGEAMARTVQQLLLEPFALADMQLHIGGSLGLAMFPDGSENGDDMLRLADVAMYAAKHEGQAFRWYHPDIDKHSKRRLSLLSSLGPAIQNQELFLTYQPKIDIWTGRLAGFEALVRWRHPQHGVILPQDFIPFAETTEAIRPLTRWVLDETIRQGAIWRQNGHALKLAVNISVRNLLDEHIEEYIFDCLDRHAYPADMLELEITESALMTRPAQAMDILQALRARGMSIAIDDFGTGYSSLAYLARLPVSTLKVDQTFVKEMIRSKADEQIVRSIIGLAHQCQLTVVAEGVEDEATYFSLLNMGCDLAQGYLIAEPMAAPAASTWIASQAASSEKYSFLNNQDRQRITRVNFPNN